MPVERGIDHRIARGLSLVRRILVLRAHPLDLDPSVDLAACARQAREDAEWWDLGSVAEAVDLRADCIRHQLSAPINTEPLAELGVAFDLEAVIFGLALAVFVDGQIV